MDRFQRESLDRYITGNYGEDQFRGEFCLCGHAEDEHLDNGTCDAVDPLTGYACPCAGWEDGE